MLIAPRGPQIPSESCILVSWFRTSFNYKMLWLDDHEIQVIIISLAIIAFCYYLFLLSKGFISYTGKYATYNSDDV